MGRAIVRDPKVFLFDEPLSNLDAKLRVAMRAEIKALHQRLKTTTVYVTHDQIEAMTMADRIVVMHDGIIEQIGTPLELFDRPGNLFVAQFIGSPAMNVFEGTQGGRCRLGPGCALAGAGLAWRPRAKVHYGIRPTDLTLADSRHRRPGGGGRAHRRRDRTAGASVGPQQLTLVMHGRTPPSRTTPCTWVDGAKAHVFDGQGGQRLYHAGDDGPARGGDGRQRLRQEHGGPRAGPALGTCTMSKATNCTRPANVAKMAAGTPLTDADRAGWLQPVAGQLARPGRAAAWWCRARRSSAATAMACAPPAPGLRFVHLHGSADLLRQRLSGAHRPLHAAVAAAQPARHAGTARRR
jgi:hypothetical protein